MKRDKIKTLAIEMVRKDGLINLTRSGLSDAAKIPDGSFPHVMGCNFTEFITELRDEKIDEGVALSVNKKRTSPQLRKENILTAAVSLAVELGYQKITRDGVAERAGVSFSLVTKYFGTMCQLKRDVMRAAIRGEVYEVVAQGLAVGDDHAKKASSELKDRAFAFMAES